MLESGGWICCLQHIIQHTQKIIELAPFYRVRITYPVKAFGKRQFFRYDVHVPVPKPCVVSTYVAHIIDCVKP